jgi:hypothetical protein
MDSSYQAQWLMKIDILSHQTDIVLKKCEQIKILNKQLHDFQKDLSQIFDETNSTNLIYYLEWYASVLFFVKSEIDHVQTGRMIDSQQKQEAYQRGWELNNDGFFLT